MRKNSELGFTLIELLVVVGIIGILSAIAIPQYALYRQRAFDTIALNDAWDAVVAEEAYYISDNSFVPIPTTVGPAVIPIPGFTVGNTVTLSVTVSGSNYVVTAESDQGAGVIYTYDNTVGVITHAIP